MKVLINVVFFAILTQNIYTQEGTCNEGADPYCALCGVANCVLCFKSFLDTSTGICQVPENADENCLFYENNSDQCTRCLPDHWLENNQCQEVSQPIERCVIYEDETTCNICDENFPDDQGNCNGNPCTQLDVNCRECYEENSEEMCYSCTNGHTVSEDGKSCVDTGNVDFLLTLDQDCLRNAQELCRICGYGYYFVEYDDNNDPVCQPDVNFVGTNVDDANNTDENVTDESTTENPTTDDNTNTDENVTDESTTENPTSEDDTNPDENNNDNEVVVTPDDNNNEEEVVTNPNENDTTEDSGSDNIQNTNISSDYDPKSNPSTQSSSNSGGNSNNGNSEDNYELLMSSFMVYIIYMIYH